MDIEKEISLDTPAKELEERLLSEYDADEVKNIIDIFNLNIKKKNVIRTGKLSELQDKIAEQMQKRIETNADAFNNKDLLDYFKTIQETIARSDISSDVKIPIQINQQQINIGPSDELDRESKNRVIAAIRSIMARQEQPLEEVEVIDNPEQEVKDIE